MDIFSTSPQGGLAQGIPSQQVSVQPTTGTTGIPIQNFPKKGSLRKFFNISSWIVLFALLPVTVLIFLSQDSIPGDLFYPVKRSLENVVLAAASVHPATRAAFRTDLTETRFKEAQSLVVSKSNASGLSAFIDEIQGTKQEVTSLKDDTQRIKAEEKLINKLEEYQAGLSTLEAKTEQNIITYQFQESPTSTPAPTSVQNLQSVTPTFTPTPTFVTLTPTTAVFPSFKPQPTPTLTLTPTPIPTSVLSPTIAPTTVAPQSENTQIIEQRRIVESIKETKEQLDKIKKDLEEKREKRNEEKEKHDERDENERKDKDNRGKKDNSDRNK